ncbi:hypothetical protein [Herbidospora sp. NBRC 101105]|uniref:hypothetical protein n=1 Tax=Herbidospora sp. NBRC 101105 TaxID=3032195 RepID=UPI0024A4235C|nr:hypothetical protein [Herbidospora sp. NBRC 101105]GLX95353.1 hypothetical protein Hesp01_33030 [Herbidospora sp. NBRC 101105]
MFNKKKSKKKQKAPARPAQGPPVQAPANQVAWNRTVPAPAFDGPAHDFIQRRPTPRIPVEIPADIEFDVDFDLERELSSDADGGPIDEFTLGLDADFDTGFDTRFDIDVAPVETVPQITTTTTRPTLTSARARSPRGSLDDETRVKLNYLRDLDFFHTLWEYFYDPRTGEIRPDRNPKLVYGLMSADLTDQTYLATPIDPAEVQEFVDLGAQSTVYFCAPQEYEGDLETALILGDYLHVMNTVVFFKEADLHRRMRRLVVNVRSQQTALLLARKLSLVFADGEIGANFVKFKVLLQSTKTDDPPKYDKLVLYYLVGDDPGDRSDVVGSRLLAKVRDGVPPGEGEMNMSPFYSRVAYFVGWAEEPKHNMPGGPTDDSFTQSRARIVQSVIESTPAVGTSKELAVKVYQAIEGAGLPWKSPHRHEEPS